MSVVLAGGGATDVGVVRQSNQDALLLGDRVYAVADGVGGHRGGEVASQTAVDAVRDNFTDRSLAGLIAAVLRANRVVWERSQADPNLRGMGTTFTAVALVEEEGEERLALVNVGDSRAYLLQRGELSQLTEDHSLVEELFREGRLSRAEADVHPQRSLITRALGLDPDVEVDNWQLLPNEGDRILLCSDGLTNEVDDDTIARVLRRESDPDAAAHELVRLAREGGGRDNITAVIVDVVDDGDRSQAASEALADEPSTHSAGEPTGVIERPAADPEPTPPPAAPVATVVEDRPRPEPRDPEADARPRPPRPRRITWRVVGFTFLLLAVLGAAVAAVGWYARRTYFVGTDDARVVIFKGRPGGLLWFQPTVERRSDLMLADVPQERTDDVKAGKEFASLQAANRYVANLRDEAGSGGNTKTFPTTPSTSMLQGGQGGVGGPAPTAATNPTAPPP